MKFIISSLLFVLFPLLPLGCSDDNILRAGFDRDCKVGDTLQVDLGASFTISLQAGLTSGCSWGFEKEFDERYVELQSYSIIDPDPGSQIDGGPMIQEWNFMTQRTGTICCTLLYSCVWEAESLNTKNIVLIIK